MFEACINLFIRRKKNHNRLFINRY